MDSACWNHPGGSLQKRAKETNLSFLRFSFSFSCLFFYLYVNLPEVAVRVCLFFYSLRSSSLFGSYWIMNTHRSRYTRTPYLAHLQCRPQTCPLIYPWQYHMNKQDPTRMKPVLCNLYAFTTSRWFRLYHLNITEHRWWWKSSDKAKMRNDSHLLPSIIFQCALTAGSGAFAE